MTATAPWCAMGGASVTDYDVLAVLEAVPYFEELGDDLGEGRTGLRQKRS